MTNCALNSLMSFMLPLDLTMIVKEIRYLMPPPLQRLDVAPRQPGEGEGCGETKGVQGGARGRWGGGGATAWGEEGGGDQGREDTFHQVSHKEKM